MALTKAELQADLRVKLEKLLREQRQVEGEKKASAEGFNAELKRIDQSISDVLGDINSCQVPLPLGPAITLANGK